METENINVLKEDGKTKWEVSVSFRKGENIKRERGVNLTSRYEAMKWVDGMVVLEHGCKVEDILCITVMQSMIIGR